MFRIFLKRKIIFLDDKIMNNWNNQCSIKFLGVQCSELGSFTVLLKRKNYEFNSKARSVLDNGMYFLRSSIVLFYVIFIILFFIWNICVHFWTKGHTVFSAPFIYFEAPYCFILWNFHFCYEIFVYVILMKHYLRNWFIEITRSTIRL